MDDQDKNLLNLLQQNNRLTSEELGEKVNLSPSAVQRRLKRLRDEGVIIADISIIDPAAAGIGLTCVVDIILESGNSSSIESFKTTMKNCAQVMQCYYVTGTYDFVIIVNTASMMEFESFSKKYLMDNSNVKHFYTHAVMDSVKMGYNLPL